MEFPPHSTAQRDFTNEDELMEVLESGTSAELEALKKFANLSPTKLELLQYYAKLRRDIVNRLRQEEIDRKRNNPKATEEELSMGAYIESIEPQVRAAVMLLRQKGYSTYESGFKFCNSQMISFEQPYLKDYTLPMDLVDSLAADSVELTIEPTSISFSVINHLDEEELTAIWNQLAAMLPDLGQPAKPCQLAAAESFREKQQKL